MPSSLASLLLVAVSPLLALAQMMPEQIWVNFFAAPSDLVITWTSATDTDVCGWRLAGTTDDFEFGGKPQLLSYSGPPVKGQPFVYTSGLIHRALLSDLPIASRIDYVIALDQGNTSTWSTVRTVRTHPGVGPDIASTLLVMADVERRPSVIAWLSDPSPTQLRLERATAGAIILGDFAYANGVHAKWDSWQRFFEPVSSQVACMTNAGNHEMTNEVGFVAFKTRLGAMPYADPLYEDSGALFYSYEVGSMHIIVLSCFSDYSRDSVQTLFLKRDLAAVNRTRTPWLLAAFHAPWYNSNTQHYLAVETMRIEYEPLFLEARLNVVLTGHVHAYQRTTLVANNTVMDPAQGVGIYHYMMGITGKSLYLKWRPEVFDWMSFRDATFWGAFFVETPNATHMRLTVYCSERDQSASGEPCEPDVPLDDQWIVNQLVANPLPGPLPSPTSSPVPPSSPLQSSSPSPSSSPSITSSITPTPTSSDAAAAAAASALNDARSKIGPLPFSQAMGTGVALGFVAACLVACAAQWACSARRRSLLRMASGGGGGGGVNGEGVVVVKSPAQVVEFGKRAGTPAAR